MSLGQKIVEGLQVKESATGDKKIRPARYLKENCNRLLSKSAILQETLLVVGG
jgi:hypothetical protein